MAKVRSLLNGDVQLVETAGPSGSANNYSVVRSPGAMSDEASSGLDEMFIAH
jgi:hypothetical protein